MEHLIHADKNRDEIGVILNYTRFDAQLRNNCELTDNTFSLEMSVGAWKTDMILCGDYVYMDGTEFGGRVECVTKNTTSDSVTIKGTTWRGMLAARIIVPDEGQAYKQYTGTDANTMIADVIGGAFGSLYLVDETQAGTVTTQFRYQTVLSGLSKVLTDNGMTLSCVYDAAQKRVLTKARRVTDYSDISDISPDLGIGMQITTGRVDAYNHMIALGQGELEERTVLELWLQDGEVFTQRPSGWAEAEKRTIKYDYPNAESEEELQKSAADALRQYAATVSASIDLSQVQMDLQLDDLITTMDRDLQISAKKRVSQRVLTITQEGMRIETEVE